MNKNVMKPQKIFIDIDIYRSKRNKLKRSCKKKDIHIYTEMSKANSVNNNNKNR